MAIVTPIRAFRSSCWTCRPTRRLIAAEFTDRVGDVFSGVLARGEFSEIIVRRFRPRPVLSSSSVAGAIHVHAREMENAKNALRTARRRRVAS